MIPETRRPWWADERKAGYGLDLRVAVTVMGFVEDAKFDRLIAPREWNRDPREGPPPFSSDIAAAWAVVEKMRERGWAVGMCSDNETVDGQPTGHCGHQWEVRLVALEGALRLVCEYADSLPLAICLAALASLPVSGETRDA